MTSLVFEPQETTILLQAQAIAIDELSRDYQVLDALASKIAAIVMKLGRRRRKAGLPMEAAEIARDTIDYLACVKAPSA